MDSNTFLACEVVAARQGLCFFYRESCEGRRFVIFSDEMEYYGIQPFDVVGDHHITKSEAKQIVRNLCAAWWKDQKHRNEIERRRSQH